MTEQSRLIYDALPKCVCGRVLRIRHKKPFFDYKVGDKETDICECGQVHATEVVGFYNSGDATKENMAKLNGFAGAAIAPMAVDVNGIAVNCEVYLNAITSEVLLEIQDEKDISAGAKLVEKSIAKWDVTDDEENVLPCDYKHLLKMPVDFIGNYLEGVKELKKKK